MPSDWLEMFSSAPKLLSVYDVLLSQFMVKNDMYTLQWNVSIRIWTDG